MSYDMHQLFDRLKGLSYVIVDMDKSRVSAPSMWENRPRSLRRQQAKLWM